MAERRQQRFVIIFNLFTIFLMGWAMVEFFSKGTYPISDTVADIYLLALTYYAGDKELRRWRREHKSVRSRGEKFVASWVALGLITLFVEVLGGAEQGYVVPRRLPLIVGGVVIIYFITQYLKAEFRERSAADSRKHQTKNPSKG